MNLYLGIPQIGLITLTIMSGFLSANSHGKLEKRNFWAWLAANSILYALLILGGFFSR